MRAIFTGKVGGKLCSLGGRTDFVGRHIAFYVLNEFRLVENVVGIVGVIIDIRKWLLKVVLTQAHRLTEPS